jgi:hypothetical protein
MFCSDRRVIFFWHNIPFLLYYLQSEQNIPLVLSSVRTEHSFGDCLL